MDLVSAFTSIKQAETLGKIQVAVAAKVLDQQKLQGSAAVQLIQAAGRGINQAGDELFAAATGLGGSVDTYG